MEINGYEARLSYMDRWPTGLGGVEYVDRIADGSLLSMIELRHQAFRNLSTPETERTPEQQVAFERMELMQSAERSIVEQMVADARKHLGHGELRGTRS